MRPGNPARGKRRETTLELLGKDIRSDSTRSHSIDANALPGMIECRFRQPNNCVLGGSIRARHGIPFRPAMDARLTMAPLRCLSIWLISYFMQ